MRPGLQMRGEKRRDSAEFIPGLTPITATLLPRGSLFPQEEKSTTIAKGVRKGLSRVQKLSYSRVKKTYLLKTYIYNLTKPKKMERYKID